MSKEKFIRAFAEEHYASELKALIKEDKEAKPENWIIVTGYGLFIHSWRYHRQGSQN